MSADSRPTVFGLLIIGDEILSGRRTDKHLTKVIELLAARGQHLSWAEYVGDEPARIIAVLRRAFATGDTVFSTGGIGATPDDHTRQCAAAALGVPLELHPEAKRLIQQRQQDMARAEGVAWEPDRPDNLQRLNMGVFPSGAQLVPNPYNQIPGFSCAGAGGGRIYFVPGFPVMAWPMIEWVLDQLGSSGRAAPVAWQERSIIVLGSGEAALTPVMERVEAAHPQVRVFSLPSVDHPTWGAHIDLGVKGPPAAVAAAFDDLLAWLAPLKLRYGPQLTRP